MNSFIERVKEIYESYGKGHDFSHIERVVYNAQRINLVEQEPEHLVQILAYLHDIFDEKFYKSNNMISDFNNLTFDVNLSDDEKKMMLSDLNEFGFKGGLTSPKLSKVGQIVSDADRLDAIGAIGIARTMMYGEILYDSNMKYEPITSLEQYRKQQRPILFHFYDKLLKLKDLMFTETGKEMAQVRHQFMIDYLNQLQKETNIELPNENDLA